MFSISTDTLSIHQIARYALSFAWIYHGFFPKIYAVAPIEKAMTGRLGFNPEWSNLITQCAGISEILIGLLLFIYYRNRILILSNILTLLLLLIYVGFLMPELLIEAFNPVTTNVMMIALSLILLQQQDNNQHKKSP